MVDYALELLSRDDFWYPFSRAYTVSLTSEHDSLEQWRAYCPRSGGVALGFLSAHLLATASDQDYLLAPCVYELAHQEAIVRQIVRHHLDIWDRRQPLAQPRQGISSHLVRDLISDLDRFAPLIKHASFAAEREWRLISPLAGEHPARAYIHLPSPTGIKQYQAFDLLTAEHPSIPQLDREIVGWSGKPDWQGFRAVVGPNVNPAGMIEAIHQLTPEEFGEFIQVERTASPYR